MAWPTTPTAGDVVTSALLELGVYGIDEPLSAEDKAFGLQKLQRLIDSINAQRELIFGISFQTFNLIASHGPHTIGPAGDFAVTPRPVDVASCSFILNSATANPVDLPVRMRDKDWWSANPLKSLQSSIVTDCYYNSGAPNGELNFFPISNVIAPVRLELWSSIANPVAYTTALTMPQGYSDLLVYNLAVALAPAFNANPSPLLIGLAQRALATVEANNNEPPRIVTTDGMPGAGGSGRPDFNFLTGMRE